MALGPGAGRETGDKLTGKPLAKCNVISVPGSCQEEAVHHLGSSSHLGWKPVALSFIALFFASFSYFPFSLPRNFLSHLSC